MAKKALPAFGVVGVAAERSAAPGAVPRAESRTVDVTAYGLTPGYLLRVDLDGPGSAAEPAQDAALRGDWTGVKSVLRSLEAHPLRYEQALAAAADVAAQQESWLYAWLDAAPGDAGAWGVHAQAIVVLAWALRTGAGGKDLLPAQEVGFLRVLNQAPAACERATALAPQLTAPWIALMSCALGLGYEPDRFRAIYAEAAGRAPSSLSVHRRGLLYWLQHCRGNGELAARFVADTLACAVPGQLLTQLRLEYLYLERAPRDAAAGATFYAGPEAGAALQQALADLAAAPADHPYLAAQRHWLAYFLTKADRFAEAMAQFKAVDGYARALPWLLFRDPAATFSATRAEALLGWQRGPGAVRRSPATGARLPGVGRGGPAELADKGEEER